MARGRLFLLFVLSLCLYHAESNPFKKMFPKLKNSASTFAKKLVGEPLFLTPLLESGKIREAQQKSKVYLPEAPAVESHAGFMTVNKKFESNMFFWYFPAVYKPEKAPVVLWLQGGPGGSSLFGLFVEHGPFSVTKLLKLEPRSTTWSHYNNVIYIDNPVGTGFSFTSGGYAQNQTVVGLDLYSCLTQFFTMFPNLQDNDFYVTGESYAGKYVPAIAHRIHVENSMTDFHNNTKINLVGMAIGDGLCDPVSMTGYGDFLNGIGLLDAAQRDMFRVREEQARTFIKEQRWLEAFQVFDDLLNGDLTGYPSLFTNTTGFKFYFNYLMTEEPQDMGYYPAFLELPSTRAGLHVGNLAYNSGEEVEKHLLEDVMKSMKPEIEEIIAAGYRVLIYSGQLDVIIAHTLTQAFLDSMTWPGKEDFDKAPRKQWHVGPDVAGYYKFSENFSQVLIRNAGHMVPYDQPKWAFDLINRFTDRTCGAKLCF